MITAALSFEEKAIPSALKAREQWVCWRAVPNGERIEKIPVSPDTGSNASSTDPHTWTDFATAVMKAFTAEDLGIGFVFTQGSGITGVDLDKCRDPQTGGLELWAEEIVRDLDSYTEISPSGCGLHIYVLGELPLGRMKKGRIEAYQHGRFFTVTGQHLPGTPATVEERTGQLNDFHARYLADPIQPARQNSRTVTVPLSDEDILAKCRAAKNAAKFEAFWRGDWSDCYASQSDADLALLGQLKFYTQDAGQLDRLFRRSGLMRPKWDERRGEQTYGERSISEALRHIAETYSPPIKTNGLAVPAPIPSEPIVSPTVIPLDEISLPELTADTFPSPLGPMIAGLAKFTETPLELSALMGLATVAASCQQVFEAEMEPGYVEPLCIWAIPALQSGNRKTAVHTAMTAPLRKKEWALCEEAKAQRAAIESERATIEARVKSLRTRLSNSGDFEDIERMKQEITQLETGMPALPTLPSLWAQDVTPEKLGTMMADNGERLAILSDEGGFFDILTGRYSNGIPNLDTCLQGHSCSPVKVNRGARDEVHMQRPTLTIGLSPQPSVLRDLSSKSMLRDRGFLARVLFALPTSRLGYRTLATEPITPAVETAYHRMVEALLAFQPPTNEDGHIVAYRLKPAPDAYQEWKEFQKAVERDMRPGEQYEHITDWAGKLPGAAVRVAGLFHCVRHAHQQPHVIPISLETMQQALGVLAVLSQHALAVFDLIGADPALEGARKVWGWIEAGHRQAFTAHECYERLRGTFKVMAKLNPALSLLCERGYVLELEEPKNTRGRPSRPFIVNPILTEVWK